MWAKLVASHIYNPHPITEPFARAAFEMLERTYDPAMLVIAKEVAMAEAEDKGLTH